MSDTNRKLKNASKFAARTFFYATGFSRLIQWSADHPYNHGAKPLDLLKIRALVKDTTTVLMELQPAKGRLRPERQSAHEAFDRIIPSGKRVPGDQVLIDALSRKPRQQTLLDHSGQRGTLAGSPRIGPGGTLAGFETEAASEPMGGLAGFDFEVVGCK